MNYKFPTIRHIDDVLPHIQGHNEFIVAQKEGGYTVINYMVALEDTFPPVQTIGDAIRRECRGIIFNTHTGEVMARRYHKFFNVGERPETSPQFVDLRKPHVVLEKLDGSMVTPLIVYGDIRWGTKMGLTDVSKPVEEFVAAHPEYEEMAAICFLQGITPIFEWCSRKQKIVIDYPEDQLILTAIRVNESGAYMSDIMMQAMGASLGIPVVKSYGVGEDIRSLMEHVRGLKGMEGFVVRFNDGHMVKIKAEDYLQLHKAKDVTQFEKNVLEIILQDKLDDLLPLLEEPYKTQVQEYKADVYRGMDSVADDLLQLFGGIICNMQSKEKREFAVHHVKKVENKEYHPFLFGMWDGKDVRAMLKAELLKACSSQNRLDNARWIMDNVEYTVNQPESADAE